MLSALREGFSLVIGFAGDVISAIFGTASEGSTAGTWSELTTMVGIGVGLYLMRACVGTVKSLIQGY